MSQPPTPSTPKLTDRKRAAIVNAAVQVFQTLGFAHSSMDKIAAKAEVSKRTVYNHFASKELLFDEILRQLWNRSDQDIDYSYQPNQTLEVQLFRILSAKAMLLSDANYQHLARVVLAEMIHSPQLAQSVVATIASKEKHLYKWLHQACKDGRLTCKDIDFAAEQLHGMIKSFYFWPQVTTGQKSPTKANSHKIIAETVSLFLHRYSTKPFTELS